MRRTIRLSLAMWVFATLLPAAAGEGRIPIPFQAPVTFPITITQPGKYVLTRDLAGPGGVPVIEISSHGVEIDLNGKVIAGGAPGISIEVVAEAVIRNGTIEGGDIGIHGVTGLNDIVVEDVHILNTALQAILLNDPDTYVIRRCIIEDLNTLQPSNGAIQITAGGRSQGTIESSVFRRSSGDGIRIEGGAGVVIRDNRIKEISGFGIRFVPEAEASFMVQVQGNTLESCGTGISVIGGGSKVAGNLVTGSSAQGIWISGQGISVLENVVRLSGSHGLLVGGGSGNDLQGNVLSMNGGFGLYFNSGATDNAFGRNSAFGNNTGGSPCVNPIGSEACDDNPAPSNYSFGDNLMPPSAGLF
ncbi:MAG: right-handed parallel beta-helix repeat-containing protein [Acidobacteriota bacterium]|nr:right-handed parallel beta-helix repeat-containing protein [Acidobacteriota bacterium]